MKLQYRILTFVLILLVSIYCLIPSVIYFRLPEVELQKIRQNGKLLEGYLPRGVMKNHIVPGLDLQGGIQILLKVDIKQALDYKLSRYTEMILKEFSQNGISAEKKDFYKIQLFSEIERKKALKLLKKKNPEVIAIEEKDYVVLYLNPFVDNDIRKRIMEQTINVLRARIDNIGASEFSIIRQGDANIQIQLPGFEDKREARRIIGRTAQLFFQICEDEIDLIKDFKDLPQGIEKIDTLYKKPDGSIGKDHYLKFSKDKINELTLYLKNKVPSNIDIKYGDLQDGYLRTYVLNKKIELTGDDIVDVQVSSFEGNESHVSVLVLFNSIGASLLDELSKGNLGKRVAIVLENKVNNAAIFQTRIPNGRAQISLGYHKQPSELMKEAQDLSMLLKTGSLPANILFLEEKSLGPSLGVEAVHKGKVAFFVGSVLVILLMIFYYRIAGLLSVVAVLYNLMIMLALLSVFNATITLPGIAGLLLIFAMAVDANVIINERIREELRKGKFPFLAVKEGYEIAFTAVFDSHMTSFLSGVVLWNMGTGPIQNFAMMLIIGTSLSLFTAVYVTRMFFDILINEKTRKMSI
ncbi:MAG: protein translocase subunit SecD [Deltaproteobacteria bacterium]|nr:MAG: protein translocase subunit SecD [Deltaproteobacteria bacterium]